MPVCFVPIGPDPSAAPAGSHGDLAFTGTPIDVGLLVLLAGSLIGLGAAALLLARRRRSAIDARPGRLRAVLSVGVATAVFICAIGWMPQNARAEAATGCKALQVVDVSVQGRSGDQRALVLQPGAPPMTIEATLINVSDRSVLLGIGAKASGSHLLAKQIDWTAVRDRTLVRGVLTDTNARRIGSLAPHQRVTVRIALRLLADTGNALQGDSVTSTFWAQATQAG